MDDAILEAALAGGRGGRGGRTAERGSARLPGGAAAAWSPPAFRVIPLDCEITAYAPDEGDEPLF